jgi:hypothetical protein
VKTSKADLLTSLVWNRAKQFLASLVVRATANYN